jgi:predicted RNase H-like nuclease (RuvC/YqgF family)
MSTKATKPKPAKITGGRPSRIERPILPIEDDERHSGHVDDYVSRNREALNASIRRSRQEVAEGKVSSKSIETIIAEGRRRHRRGS